MKIHLIRHGMTEANEKRLYCGNTDLSISETGRKRLEEGKKQVDYPRADLFATSGLKRTVETLAVLYGGENYQVFPELREIHFGDFEMRSFAELENNKDYLHWIGDVENRACPRGESKKAFDHRVLGGFANLKRFVQEEKAKSLVMITHAGVIITIMDDLFPKHKGFYEWQPDYGKGYTIDLDGPQRQAYQLIEWP